MAEPEVTDWAYAAGFVDGEGCVSVSRSFVTKRGRYQYGVQVVVANREREVLDWFQTTWGGWVVAVSSRQGRARECWNWRCMTGLSAKPFLTGIRPWLRIKGRQCDNALAMIDLLQRGRGTLRSETYALASEDLPSPPELEFASRGVSFPQCGLMLLISVIIGTIKRG